MAAEVDDTGALVEAWDGDQDELQAAAALEHLVGPEGEEEDGVVRSGKDRLEEMQQDGADDAAQRSVGQENAGRFVLG